MAGKKILFVVHESKKSGAPLLLLHLVKELITWSKIQPYFLLKATGELDEDFKVLGPTFFYVPKYLRKLDIHSKILRRLLPKQWTVKTHQKKLKRNLQRQGFDVMYFNSLGCQDLFPFLMDLEVKRITHVHELKEVIQGMNTKITTQMLSESDFLISSYRTVSHMLLKDYKVDKEKIFENSVYLFPDRLNSINKLLVGGKHGGNQVFRIGGCGPVEHRKGTDMFVTFAIKMLKEFPSCSLEFSWIGNDSTPLAKELKEAISKEKFQDSIKFVGVTSTPESYFMSLDVFFLSSREEAFGLVGLENAYCEVPLVSFDIDGDLPLFIKEYNCGEVIPKFSYSAFSQTILKLKEQPDLLSRYGKHGKRAVIEHFDIAQQAKLILNVIEKLT